MTESITFENLPLSVSVLINEVQELKRIILEKREKPQPKPERLLTIRETAEFLNLTVPTIYSKVSRNELPFMKKGKRLYFSDKELMQYIKDGKCKSIDELNAEAEDYLKKKGGTNA